MLNRYMTGGLAGFIVGAGLIHPLSMLFQGLVHPTMEFDAGELRYAFDAHHLPMALYFGLLLSATGVVFIYLSGVLNREKRRVEALEGLLPICSYCRKIRDDSGVGHGNGRWYEAEEYISMRTDTDFSHGICDACYEKVMAEVNRS